MTDRLIPYGAPVVARDIEAYAGPEPPLWLTRLGRLLIQAELGARGLSAVVPEGTDRINVADGGVDIEVVLALEGLPTGDPAGLVNPGRTVYQIKWRTDRRHVPPAAKGALAALRAEGPLPDSYVFITNGDVNQDEIRDCLLEGCGFPPHRIAVMGATQLADRVTLDPRIRIPFFYGAQLSLCTWDDAARYAERRYRMPAPPRFYGRQQELARIARFVGDPTERVLALSGPPAVGMTRLALEALASVRDQVVWARDIPLQVPALIDVLDAAGRPAILVIDVPSVPTDLLLERAVEAARLKTILITTGPVMRPHVAMIPVTPFAQPQAMDFMKWALPSVPLQHAQWLHAQCGGFPGLLVEGAAALATLGEADPLDHETLGGALARYDDRTTAPVGQAADTLAVLSLLPELTWPPGAVPPDAERVAAALGVDVTRLGADLDTLRRHGLVESIGWSTHHTYRVSPPLLARRRARRAILAIGDALPQLFRELSPEGRAGLVRRLGEAAEEPALSRVVRWLWDSAGLFTDPQAMADQVSCIAALAETRPLDTVPRILRGLDGSSLEARLSTGEGRRALVRALAGALRHEDAFEPAVQSLLLFAEAETERYANNATHVFAEAFHWLHPEIPRDARARAYCLRALAAEATPERRVIVARAAAEALNPDPWVSLSQEDSLTLPRLGWRATSWAQVHEAVRTFLTLLRDLATDPDEKTRDAARRGLAGGALAAAQWGLPGDAADAFMFLADLPLSPAAVSVTVDCASAFLDDAERRLKATSTDAATRSPLETAVGRVAVVFDRLTTGDFRARFYQTLGPAPMRPHRRLTGTGGWEELVRAAEQLAADVIAQPDVLTDELLDWATGDEQSHAGFFLRQLGVLDRDRRWLPALERRVNQMRAGAALATYVEGWAQSDLPQADAYLEVLVDRPGNWSMAAVQALQRLGPTERRVDLVLRAVAAGGVPRWFVTRQLSHHPWADTLPTPGLIRFIRGLRDGTPEADWSLLEVVEAAWDARGNDSDTVGPLAAELLERCAGELEGRMQEAHHWDALATKLTAWNREVGFRLLFAHREHPARHGHVSLRFDRTQLIEALSKIDRPRVVRELLTAAAAGPRALEIQLDLPYLLRPGTDTETLIELADGVDAATARLIAGHVDAELPGFERLFVGISGRWGYDPTVRETLAESVATLRSGAWDDPDELNRRLSIIEPLARHENPQVADAARATRRALLERLGRRGHGG